MTASRELELLSQKITMALGTKNATLDVFLLKHEEIKALKARFIRKKTEPNVLSFVEPDQFPHPERGRRAGKYLGEIYLNADILAKSPDRAAPLLLHGILHLLGHDHLKKKDAAEMEALEEKILLQLGT